MKRAILLALAAGSALAAQAQPQSFVERARVQSVEPQYQAVQVPRQECSSQWVNEAQPVGQTGGNHSYTGAVVGGLAGGVIGNQVGQGHGREAATAVGAVIGALTGDRIGNQGAQPPQTVYQNVQREVRTCRTVNDVQQQLTGYRVTYEYNGNLYSTVTRQQPGRTLPIQVSITPMEPGYHRR